MNPNDVLILHSGGIDSTGLIEYFIGTKSNVSVLHVNYGQVSYHRESLAVKSIVQHYNISSKEISLQSDVKFKNGFIQGRNLLLLSSALLSCPFQFGQIAIGIHSGTDYVDCGPDFLDLVNRLFLLYTGGQIVAVGPFRNWNKRQIYQYCLKQSVPLPLTYSCELGLNQPCGKCSSCKEITILNDSKN